MHDVTILGPGTVDCNRPKRSGPKPITLRNSSKITARDATIANAPNYAIISLGCDHVVVDGVRIGNCFVNSADDAIY